MPLTDSQRIYATTVADEYVHDRGQGARDDLMGYVERLEELPPEVAEECEDDLTAILDAAGDAFDGER